jgi:ABC-type hemin transport system ATPase subunit
MTSALEATGLGKRYRRTWALRDCTLELPRGRIAALVGPNGAGKTTLLHLAVGLLALLAGWWITPLNDATGYRFTWLFFDQQGPVLVGYALFAFALGVLAGTLTGRQLTPVLWSGQ